MDSTAEEVLQVNDIVSWKECPPVNWRFTVTRIRSIDYSTGTACLDWFDCTVKIKDLKKVEEDHPEKKFFSRYKPYTTS